MIYINGKKITDILIERFGKDGAATMMRRISGGGPLYSELEIQEHIYGKIARQHGLY